MDWILGPVLVLGVMILFHEWGHFIVARLFGVRVDVFSIGFGPRLFGWKRGATDYRVSALPLGGYVRMAGQELSEVDSGEQGPTGAPDELVSKPRWQRALISFGGPAVNLILPVILLAGFFLVRGIPYPAYWNQPLQIIAIPANAPARPSALQAGDRVLSLNGVQNPNWDLAEKSVAQLGPNGVLKMDVENAGARRTVELTLQPKDLEQPEYLLGYRPVPPVLEEVAPGTPADRGGLRSDDRIVAVDGQKVAWWGQFTERVRGSSSRPIALDVDRKGQSVHLVITPQPVVSDRGETLYQIGVQVHEQTAYRRVGFPEGVQYAGLMTYERIGETIGVVQKLFSGRVSVKQLQGVVGISRAAGQAVHKGSLTIVSLMVLISVNLGILNLLPIPILDGGHILLLAIEGVRRRDLSLAFKERFIQVGLVFLLVLFAIVMYNDVVRLLPIHS
jgi:regulator of sigma E protease